MFKNILYYSKACYEELVCKTTWPTRAELIHRVEKSKAVDKNRVALTLLLAVIEILSFDTKAAEGYGEI